ncbi:hypothetical protein LUW75_01675 [Streptomyces sp. MRC013]|uniref:hypothetical protein n=1 Tax=Streptomyces sp. MRC013 TaxID=2898276 RepID=UPI0020274F50|nr:hypothetical protein [Streptomyces sp. MRC013]URM88943.1 hypothetical protein LUW75_01675 [Streptomyces sp. MRC013]
MNAWLQAASVLVTGAGLVSAAVACRLTGDARRALAVLLDFLTAAGLMRLTGDPSWGGILAAAAVVALRRVIGSGLGLSRAAP